MGHAISLLFALVSISRGPVVPISFFAFVQAQPISIGQDAKNNSTHERRFKLTKISNGKSEDGTFWTIYDIEAPSGQPMFTLIAPYSSVQYADQQFELYLKNAIKIIRRSAELNKKGEPVGKRALAEFGKTKTMGPSYTVCWTSGATFTQITGEHLEDVLELESSLKERPLTEILKQDK